MVRRRSAGAAAPLLALCARCAAYPGQLECGGDAAAPFRAGQVIMGATVRPTLGNTTVRAYHMDSGAPSLTAAPGEVLLVRVSGVPPGQMVVARASDASGTLAGRPTRTGLPADWLRRKCPGQLYSMYKPGAPAEFEFEWALDCDGGDADVSITVGWSAGLGRATETAGAALRREGAAVARCRATPAPPTPAPAPAPAAPNATAWCAGPPTTRRHTLVIDDWVVDFLRPTKGRRVEPFFLSPLTRKAAVLANGSYPAPPIEACENDTIEVTVVNRMKTNEAVIHWHGIHSTKYPWADGAIGVTQAGIRPGDQMLYRFEAWPPGTHYYHSHMDGYLQARGLRGPVVVHKRRNPQAPLYDLERTVMLSDEWQDPGVCLQAEGYTNNEGNPVCAAIRHMSFDGEWGNGTAAYPYPVLDLYPGKCTRFRFFNAASNAQYFVVEMAGHDMTLVSTDGYDVHPVKVRSFRIAVGERADVVVCGDQPPGYYRVNATYDVACSLLPGMFQPYGFGVPPSCQWYAFLRYAGAGAPPPSAPDPASCDRPFGGACLPAGTGGGAGAAGRGGAVWDTRTSQTLFRTTTPLPDTDFAGDEPDEPDWGFTIDLGNLGPDFHAGASPLTRNRWYADQPGRRRSWTRPATPLLHTKGKCGAEGVPVVDVPETLPDGRPVRNVEIVFNNLGPAAHVLHMHGMPWKVVNVAEFDWCAEGYNGSADTLCWNVGYNTEYSNDWCPYDQALGNPTQSHGFMQYYWGCRYNKTQDRGSQHLRGALVKDSFTIWRRSWAVVRFPATRPGVWLVHCHLEQHIPLGMVFAVNVRPSEQPPVPRGVPTEGPCPVWSWNDTASRLRGEVAAQRGELAARDRTIARLQAELRGAAAAAQR